MAIFLWYFYEAFPDTPINFNLIDMRDLPIA